MCGQNNLSLIVALAKEKVGRIYEYPQVLDKLLCCPNIKATLQNYIWHMVKQTNSIMSTF